MSEAAVYPSFGEEQNERGSRGGLPSGRFGMSSSMVVDASPEGMGEWSDLCGTTYGSAQGLSEEAIKWIVGIS
jgi:hypothetical protein